MKLIKLTLIILIFGGGFFYTKCKSTNECESTNMRIKIARAETVNHVMISEILPDPAGSDKDNEWLELYNPTDAPIDISGWTGGSSSNPNQFTIPVNTYIGAYSFYLIGETNITGRDLLVDLSITNTDKNANFTIKHQSGDVVDELGWDSISLVYETSPVSTPGPGKSLERKPGAGAGNGQDTDNNSADFFIQATPNPQNSQSKPEPPISGEPLAEVPAETPPLPPAGGAAPPPIIPKIYSDKIIINELLINPEDSDADNEFIELYNLSDSGVELSGWKIEDTQGATKRFTIPEGTRLEGWGYLVFYSSETRLVFNNSGDGARLYWPNDRLTSQTPVNSGAARDDISYSFDGETWQWTVVPTPGKKNEILSDKDRTYLVTRVIDGDTIELETGEKVRYIGIDTPEIYQPKKGAECYGLEAMEKNINLVLNKRVRLEKDATNKDGYGRILRYVYIEDTFVNEYLVEWGYAYSNPYPPDIKYQERLNKAEDEARRNERGLWKVCGVAEVPLTSKIYSDKIIINEFLPNPIGADTKAEWIELKNIGDVEVNLEGWQLADATSRAYTISSDDFSTTTITAQEYFLIKREISGVALNNTGGDKVQLYWPNNELALEVSYKEKAGEETSYARDEETREWSWTTSPTPDSLNVITRENKPPVALIDCPTEALVNEPILCDGSDSYDPEDEGITFLWYLDNISSSTSTSPTYIFEEIGNYEISLTVVDSRNLSSAVTHTITVSASTSEITGEIQKSYVIYISEVLPNPEGADAEAEFIELYNAGTSSIDLSGWQLDDVKDGGSRPYTLAKNTIIKAKEYSTFKRSETNIALNNDYDSVRLINPAGKVVSEISYDDVIANASYALADDVWRWSNSPTPSEENKIISAEVSKPKTAVAKAEAIILTIPEEIRNYENNTRVNVRGVVTVEPGILGANIFYIQGLAADRSTKALAPAGTQRAKTGSPGIQIYSYKKDFPSLAVGDLIFATGVLSESSGEKRLKTATKNDIRVAGHQDPPEPQYFKNSEIDEECEGQLVIIEGELIERRGASYFVADGSGEIKVYIKNSTGIKKPTIDEGEMMVVAGIVSRVGGEIAVLPRYGEDIRKTQVSGTKLADVNSGQRVIKIPEGKSIFNFEKYVWILNGVLILVLGRVMIIKWRANN